MVARLREAGRFAYDLELVGNSPYHSLLVGVAASPRSVSLTMCHRAPVGPGRPARS